MATNPVTRAKLISRVAQRANTSGYADTSTDGEVSQLVDTALAKIHNQLVSLYQDYFTTEHVINIVGLQDTYALPADFMKTRAVFYSTGVGTRYPLRRLEITDLVGQPVSTTPNNVLGGYVIMNNSIVLYPQPANIGATVHFYYIPQYTPPLNDATPIDYQIAFGWDEWVVNDCVIQIRNKAMMPADELVNERARIEQRITREATQRNAVDPPRVLDRGWGRGYSWTKYSPFAFRG